MLDCFYINDTIDDVSKVLNRQPPSATVSNTLTWNNVPVKVYVITEPIIAIFDAAAVKICNKYCCIIFTLKILLNKFLIKLPKAEYLIAIRLHA